MTNTKSLALLAAFLVAPASPSAAQPPERDDAKPRREARDRGPEADGFDDGDREDFGPPRRGRRPPDGPGPRDELGPRGEGGPREGGPREGGPREGGPREGPREGLGPLGPGRPGAMRRPLGDRPILRDPEALRRVDPEMAKLVESDRDLERQSRELVIRYRRAASDQRDAIKKELADLAQKQFTVRIERRELEMKRIEEQLARLREAVKRRGENKEAIVKKRVDELLNGDDDLEF